MMRPIDRYLDHTTMYRLVLHYLVLLLAVSFLLGFVHVIPRDPTALAFSTTLLLASSYLANRIFAWVFSVPPNVESVHITALILALIMDPVTAADPAGVGALVFAAVWANAAKYIFAIGRKHIFNPAAFGVVLTALLLDHPATWWVGGNLPLLPFVLAGGMLVVRKLRRFDLVASFVLVAAAVGLATAAPAQWGGALSETLLHSPLFFFAFVMLTEPLTAPTGRWQRLAFAVLVGALFAPNVHVGSFYFTPELALLAGNLFAWAVGPRGRLVLTLDRIERVAADAYDFVFSSDRRLAFQPGQYLEWTLPVPHPDNRGNRRYFTLASAPTEDELRLGVKFYPRSSAFKQSLSRMVPGDAIHVTQLAGAFILPSDPRKKLAFIAGGIGITPFRSMLRTLLDEREARDIVVVYGVERPQAIAYRHVLDAAEKELGIPTVYAVERGAAADQYPGLIDANLIQQAVPDMAERTFYVSGPQSMVDAVRRTLHALGVPRSRIKVDFFPGFA